MRPVVFDAQEAVPVAPTVTGVAPNGKLGTTANTFLVPGGTSVTGFSWTDNAATEYKYVVARKVNKTFQDIGTALANARSLTLTQPVTVAKGSSVVFAVRAVGANGTGETQITVVGQ